MKFQAEILEAWKHAPNEVKQEYGEKFFNDGELYIENRFFYVRKKTVKIK